MAEIKKPQSTLYPQGSMHARIQQEQAKKTAKKKRAKTNKGKAAGRMR